ncbi:MAG: ABC transporter permease [Planctomycetes bacterium]|nr:ABC transporter permease [Planctomycetota bacterium]
MPLARLQRSVESLGAFLVQSAQSSGFGLQLLASAGAALPHAASPRRIRDILNLLYTYSFASLVVVLVVSLFTGLILALNFLITVESLGQEHLVGRIVAVSMVREMGPLMTAVILSASIGCSIAAEIGTMRVTEEIDALEIMSISPVRFLVLPRLIALLVLGPMMTVFSGVIGILGGAAISYFQYAVSWESFKNDAIELLKLKDIFTGLLKSVVFGATIAIVGCTQGLQTRGGATGVGRSTRRSVVVSFLLFLILGYYITWAFYK